MTLPQRDYTRIPGAWPYMDLTELSLREAQDQVTRALENVAEPAPSTDWPRPPENRRGFTATDRLFNEQVRQQRRQAQLDEVERDLANRAQQIRQNIQEMVAEAVEEVQIQIASQTGTGLQISQPTPCQPRIPSRWQTDRMPADTAAALIARDPAPPFNRPPSYDN